MIDFKQEIAKILNDKIESLTEEDILTQIEIPPSYEMGDYAFPVFSLAKIFRKNPNMIAEEMASSIDSKYFEKVESKGAYINFFTNKEALSKTVIEEILKEKENYGKSKMGKDKTIIVEYSSPNIAKPFHIGHIRTTIIGDSLKKIHKFLGYNVVSINHLGDYGTQFGMLIYAIKNWGNIEEIEKNPIPELLKLYVRVNKEAEENEEIKDECRHYFASLEKGDEEAVKIWKWIREISLKEFNMVYDLLGIEFDSYNGESFYSDKMQKQVDRMEKLGILKDSEGAKIVDLEKYNLPPALILKSDGSTIYITRDIAAAEYRHETYHPEKNIYVVATEQNLHFKQLKAVLEEMQYDWYDEVTHVAFGMINLADGKLSTRQGRVVYLIDVLNKAIGKIMEILDEREKTSGVKIENKEELAKQVGIGAIKFQELFNQRIKDYTFDWDKTLSFEGESGPYVQYAHARICSLLNKGNFDINSKIDPTLLNNEMEINILRNLYKFTEVVKDAAEKYEPFFISRYVVELAKDFNKYYNQVTINVDDEKLKNTRLMLCYSVKNVISEGLSLLGIEAPEKM